MLIDIRAVKDQKGCRENYSLRKELEEIHLLRGSHDLTSPLLLTISLTNTGNSFIMKVNYSVHLRLECSRCLKTFDYSMQNTFEREFFLRERADREELEDLHSREIIEPEQKQLDIMPALKEAMILAMPIKTLCSPDCRGLCARCGANLNEEPCSCEEEDIDPRLSKLREFRDRA